MNSLTPPVRTRGDGMENAVDATTELPKQPRNSLGKKLIYRPADFNQFPSPPPPIITGKIVHLVPKHAIHFKKSKPGGSMKSKEPRFVPYEPYKAAVNPIIPYEKEKGERKDKKRAVSLSDVMNAMSVKAESADSGVVPSDSKWEDEKKVFSDEIKLLKEEKAHLEGQLKFHAQVNCDLKTLLVAAVGEDLEMRVQLLTEDKLQLARALLSSAQVCTTHQERTEFLAGQCEVWRSKFLASSLMLEDLAHRKASLAHHATQLEEVTQALLEERTAVWEAAQNTFRSLSVLRDGFAPGEHSELPPTATVVDLALVNQNLSQSLKNQLLGGRETKEPILSHLTRDTSTVQAARKLLGGVEGMGRQDAASNAVMGAAIAIATRQPVCCAHCSGQVKMV